MTSDESSWRSWIGRKEQRTDVVTAAPIASLFAMLDRDDRPPLPGSHVPPLAHWLYFTPLARQREIGPDGHPQRGEFLPPVPLPRRMWAGGRLRFERPLRVGDEVTLTSRIADVTIKEGRSGRLVFVAVHREIADAGGTAIVEEQDIVYRGLAASGTTAPTAAARTDEAYGREVAPDPVLLFRYSALTFNAHRIHYDRSYVTDVEGYPGLVVHGPLIATLLVDLLCRQHPDVRLRAFRFRALRPLFDIHRFAVCGRQEPDRSHALWARDHQGALAMEASAELY